MATYFITAIDTDAGKTIATGCLAKYLKSKGREVVTMKLAQTGCVESSDDLMVHRQIMGEDLHRDDVNGSRCSYLFSFPASPHLSANMEGVKISPHKLSDDIKAVENKYDNVLVEGVGGLMVPLNNEVLVADFIQTHQFPTILITSGRLGSINHTLLTLEVMKNRGIELYGMVYNQYPITAPEITNDSREYLKKALMHYYPDALWGELGVADEKMLSDTPCYLDGWF